MAYFEQTKLTNSGGTVINPAEKQDLYTFDPPSDAPAPVVRTAPGSVDDQIALLRRIAKVLESTAACDPQQRQRLTIDSITAGVALPTVTTVGTVTTVTGVTTVSTVTTVSNITAMAGWNQNMFADPARTAYNTGIRQRLSFG
jgi:hypothetical protein